VNGVWRIGVQQPDNSRGSILGIVEVGEESIVTSGPYERFFVQNGVRYHHIINPDTGYPARNGLESVTIVAVDSMLADGLSTAVFVQGLETGVDFVNSLPEVEAIFVTEDDHVVVTRGLEDRFELFNPERYSLEVR
jgi:thiamine biosynthesis lipoprotein